MRTWISFDKAPRDGRWIIAICRHDPDRRAVVRWDPQHVGDACPWQVASGEHGYPDDAFTDWMPFPAYPQCDADEAA